MEFKITSGIWSMYEHSFAVFWSILWLFGTDICINFGIVQTFFYAYINNGIPLYLNIFIVYSELIGIFNDCQMLYIELQQWWGGDVLWGSGWCRWRSGGDVVGGVVERAKPGRLARSVPCQCSSKWLCSIISLSITATNNYILLLVPIIVPLLETSIAPCCLLNTTAIYLN